MPGWRGVVTRTHSYGRSRNGPLMLFDDRADPDPMTNLVDDPTHADTVRDLDAMTRA